MCVMPFSTVSSRSMRLFFPSTTSARSLKRNTSPAPSPTVPSLQLELLQQTTEKMARNGCKKVLIVNGHGGNNHLLPFFAQSQLASPHDYVVYVFSNSPYPPGR